MEQNRLYGAGGKRGIIALHIIGGGAVTKILEMQAGSLWAG
jgi:hypothetical protein